MLEPGTVKRIPAGSKIIFQLHYSKATGKVEKDRSMIGLVFAKEPPDKHVYTQPVSQQLLPHSSGRRQSPGDGLLDHQR